MTQHSNKLLGILLVTIAALSWSTAGLFTRVVTTDIPTTMFWRSLFGALLVWAFYVATRRDVPLRDHLKLNKGEIITVVVSSVASYCFIAAFFYTSIANVAFVYGTSALVTVMVAWALLSKRPDRITIMAALVATLGALILVEGNRDFSDLLGLGLAASMTLLMASIPVLVHRFPAADTIKVAYMSGLAIALGTLPFISGFGLSVADLFWLASFGLVTVGFGFGVYMVGSRMVQPATAALILLTEVPLAPIWAALLFGELISGQAMFGGALIIAAALAHTITSTREK